MRPDRWIVADDGRTPADCTAGQIHVRLPFQEVPRESYRKNWLAGLEACGAIGDGDVILFIEDDDWYRDDYIAEMVAMLKDKRIAGESRAKYYNVRYRRHLIHANRNHASLSQTGIRGPALLNRILQILRTDPKPESLDGGLWRRCHIPASDKSLRHDSRLVVGMKGMSPRAAGVGHGSAEVIRGQYKRDPELHQLRRWIGDDAANYVEFYEGDAA